MGVQLLEIHLNDDEIVKCSSCHKILKYKDFSTHQCEVPWKATITILVHNCVDLSDDGKDILAVAHDGTRYLLKTQKPTPIPFIRRIFTDKCNRRRANRIGDDFSHGKKKHFGDEDFTEPGIDKKSHVSTYQTRNAR
jgi:hypothetical protein